MTDRNILLTLAYDGSLFCGWQRQSSDPSVQQVLEEALEKIHNHKVQVTGSGRTDSGVHATGQCANFYSDSSIPVEKFVPALNSLLPGSIRVRSARQVASEFHARYDATQRYYRYKIFPWFHLNPGRNRYVWHLRRLPNLNTLNAIAAEIIGTHDFTTYSAAGDKSKSKVRQITSAFFSMNRDTIDFTVSGNAFLWRMVRSLTGTMIELEKQGMDHHEMRRRLNAGDRSLAGTTAPAAGLYLEDVRYE